MGCDNRIKRVLIEYAIKENIPLAELRERVGLGRLYCIVKQALQEEVPAFQFTDAVYELEDGINEKR